MAIDHRAIGRNPLAWAYPHTIADLHLFNRQFQFLSAANNARGLRLQVQEPFDGLGAPRLYDQRQPLREDVVGADHHGDGEEGSRRISGPIEDEPDNPAGDARERSDLKKHMLVENAAAQRLEGHEKNVPSDSEDETNRQRAREPWRGMRQISLQIKVEQAQRHHGEAQGRADSGPQPARSQDQENEAAKTEANQRGQEADPAHRRIGNDRNRRDTENHRKDEAPGFTDQIALFFFEGPELAGVGDRIADVTQSLQQLLRTRDSRVIFDERLFVRQAHSDPVDARRSSESFFDRTGAERTMKTADPSTYFPAIGSRRGLFVPKIEC